MSVSEGAGEAVVAVSRVGGADGALTAYYKTPAGGTARQREDFIGVTGTLVWADGDTEDKTFSVPILDDGRLEPDEYFFLDISAPLGNEIGSPSKIRITIVDNEQNSAAGSVQFAAAQLEVSEGAGEAVVTVTRAGGADGTVSAYYKTPAGGSAKQREDFVGVTGLLVWADGDAADKTFSVPILDDGREESAEDFFLELSTPLGNALGSPARIRITIADNEQDSAAGSVQFAVPVIDVPEGAGEAVITVSRAGGSQGALTAYYKTPAGGTAKQREDFIGVTGVLTWADGDAQDKSFVVPILDDGAVEPQEYFFLDLSAPLGNAVGSPARIRVNIGDDDALLPDLDGDGVADADDNCPAVANFGQVDMDSNGIGDACQTVLSCPPVGSSVAAEWTGELATGLEPAVAADAQHVPFLVPAGCDVANVQVQISWDNSLEDLDLYVTDSAGKEYSSARPSPLSAGVEVLDLPNAQGLYEARAEGYANVETRYTGRIIVTRAASNGGSAECEAAFGPASAGAGAAQTAADIPFGVAGRLILSFPDGVNRHDAVNRLGDALAQGRIAPIGVYEFKHLPQAIVYAELLTPVLVEQLRAELAEFRLISIDNGDRPLAFLVEDSVPLIGVPAARDAWATADMPLTGQGIGAAVIDTGLDTLQGDFPADRVKENVRAAGDYAGLVGIFTGNDRDGTAFVSAPTTEWSSNGHGTHISGTIMGDGSMSGGRFVGVAPGVNFVHIAVEYGTYIYTLVAMDHILDVRDEYNIRVTNHSYGPLNPSGQRFDPTSSSAIAIKALYDAGVIPVFAAGNSGSGNDTMGSDAQNPCAISVASGRKDYSLSSYSSRGVPGNPAIEPDITAPGEDIIATRATNAVVSPAAGGNPLPESDAPYYISMSGTSMAAPHVVGAVAVILEANPALNFGQVLDIIKDTARPMPGYQSHEVGAGYLDVFKALADPRVLNKSLGDADGDGSLDFEDNCPLISNPDQADSDFDGIGDACDAQTASSCEVPGYWIAQDAAGDDNPPLPTADAGQGDILSLRVSEPEDQFGKLIFQLQMRSLGSLPPNVEWFVTFEGVTKSDYNFGKWHVEMQTDETSTPSFSYGRYNEVQNGLSEGPGASDEPTATAVQGSSYDPETGIIELHLNTANFGGPGLELKNVQSVIYQLVGALGSGSLQVIDRSSARNYTLRTANACDDIIDNDGDGVDDSIDNCPVDPNPDQADLDTDGQGDVCDADRDGDGVPNDQDALPDDPTETLDTDGDGIGDNSDPDNNDGPDGDKDFDGTRNADDICPGHDDSIDTDGDGIPDGCDHPDAYAVNITSPADGETIADNVTVSGTVNLGNGNQAVSQRLMYKVPPGASFNVTTHDDSVTPELLYSSSIGPGTPIGMSFGGEPYPVYICTSNFVWKDQNGKAYLGAAGHCFIESGYRTTHGANAPGAPLYDPSNVRVFACYADCAFGGLSSTVTEIVLGNYVELGEVAYARQEPANGDINVDGDGVGWDFGIVEIPEQYYAYVDTAMPGWGGPYDVWSDDSFGLPLLLHGNAAYYGETAAQKNRMGASLGTTDGRSWDAVIPSWGGDSGSSVSVLNDPQFGPEAMGLLTHGVGVGDSVVGTGAGVTLMLASGTIIPQAIQMAKDDAELCLRPLLAGEDVSTAPGPADASDCEVVLPDPNVVEVRVDDGAWQTATTDWSAGTWSVDLTGLAPGSHTLHARLVRQGTTLATDSVNVTVQGASSACTLQNGASQTVSGNAGDELACQFALADGASNLSIAMTGPACEVEGAYCGSQDWDLYVRYGAPPTQSAYDCRPYQTSNNETCSFSGAGAGTWYVMVHAYQGSGEVQLQLTY